MFKKLFIASVIFSAALNAEAAMAPYIGAGLGVNVNSPTDSSRAASFRGAPFSVLAGIGGSWNDSYFLAAEVNATLLTSSLSGSGFLKTSYGYGLSVLPGYQLNEHTAAFVRVGMVRDRFSNQEKFSTGGKLGLGLQTTVTQNVSVRGEYDFTAYSAMNTNLGSIAPREDAATLSLIYHFG